MNETETTEGGFGAKTAIGALVLVAVLGGGYYLYQNRDMTPTPQGPAMLEYSNATYGIAFKYPETYQLFEREVGTAERGHYVIGLIDKSYLPPQNGEGPPAITIEVFQNNLDKLSILDWLTTTNQSNFKLGDGTYATVQVAGATGAAYSWSGLYATDSVALPHRENILLISAGYLTADDQIRVDFLNVLASLGLE